jgi:fructose-bisphosphate aldolase, class I
MNALHEIAASLVTPGKGILAADESIGTMSSRLEGVGVAPTAENRRVYRELLVTAQGLSAGVSGVILCDETLRQQFSDGQAFARATRALNILPGIKVDTGARPLPGAPGESVTEGLDGLPGRLAEYAEMGAAFAKWRAVITIGEDLPTNRALEANAHALARYAVACQEAGIVPIVEPEVLMDGSHGIDRCAEVTLRTLGIVFEALQRAGTDLRGIVLKPNMVVPGNRSGEQAHPAAVAERTVAVLERVVPIEVPGIAFLSGGQAPDVASANLAAMQALHTPWPLTFSFGRALVDPALRAWAGKPAAVVDGQNALRGRVFCNVEALGGRYDAQTERKYAGVG